MSERYKLAQKTNEELTALLNANGDPRRVSFDDCSDTTACRTHAIDKLLTIAGHAEEVGTFQQPHPSLEEVAALGLSN